MTAPTEQPADDPPDTAAQLAAARERHRTGAIDAAASIYQSVLVTEPDNARALYLLAVANLQRGDAEGAIALLERARAVAPGDADVLNTLGEALRVQGRGAAAADAFRGALALAPDHPHAAANLARVADAPAPAARPPRPHAPEQNTRPLLHALVSSGRVGIEIDLARLDSMDSPVVMQSDMAKWFMLLIVAAAAAFWLGGLWVGLGVTVAGLALYQGLGRPHQRRRLIARIRDQALVEDGLWRRLWRFGGIILVSLDPARPGRCAAPDGDWIAFARQLAGRDGSGEDGGVESAAPKG
jgi:tetratricopeptide (TPR) repeat protein